MNNPLSKISIPQTITRKAGHISLVAKENLPSILLYSGIATFVGTAVLASIATLKAQAVVEDLKEQIEDLKVVNDVDDNTPRNELPTEYLESLGHAWLSAIGKLAVIYAPAIATATAATGMLLYQQKIMISRQAALTAISAIVSKAYDAYRQNVRDTYGDEVDEDMLYGLRREEVKETVVDPETGESKKVKRTKRVIDMNKAAMPSPYARIFDEASLHYQRNPSMNLYFLRSVQNSMNVRLKARGHVFLNEVYDALGMDRSAAGQLVGWIANIDKGDGYIDFGLYDPSPSKTRRDFINGLEDHVLLDFNVDGIITSHLAKS